MRKVPRAESRKLQVLPDVVSPEVSTDGSALAHRPPTVSQKRPADPRQQNRAAQAGEQAGGYPGAQVPRRVAAGFDLICNAQRRVSTRPSHAPASSRHVECTCSLIPSRNIVSSQHAAAQHAARHGHGMSNNGSAWVDCGPQAGGAQVDAFGLACGRGETRRRRRGAPAWCMPMRMHNSGPRGCEHGGEVPPNRDGLAGPCAGATQRGWVHRTAGAIYRPCACTHALVLGEDVKCPSSRWST